MQDKGSCWLGDACLLTGQVARLAGTATRSGEGHSKDHFTLFQSYLSNTSPLSATLKRGLCQPDLHDSATSDQRWQECLASSGRRLWKVEIISPPLPLDFKRKSVIYSIVLYKFTTCCAGRAQRWRETSRHSHFGGGLDIIGISIIHLRGSVGSMEVLSPPLSMDGDMVLI
jgi:hypothetical protein